MLLTDANLVVLSQHDTQELLTSSEIFSRRHSELSDGVELHAPFVDWAGVKRPVIVDKVKAAEPGICKVAVNLGPGGAQLSLLANGSMGRPLYGLSGFKESGFDADSYFGDEEGKEVFKKFSLHVSNSGLAYMTGIASQGVEAQTLSGVSDKEMHVFGQAVFRGVGNHFTKV